MIEVDKLIEMVKETSSKYPIAFDRYPLGMPIQESQWLVNNKYIERTLRERLFSLYEGKWRPFLCGYSIRIPDPLIYIVHDCGRSFIVGHPATIARLKDALNATAQK